MLESLVAIFRALMSTPSYQAPLQNVFPTSQTFAKQAWIRQNHHVFGYCGFIMWRRRLRLVEIRRDGNVFQVGRRAALA